jgi:putative SOS response-associated peptidase YedK
MSGATKPPSEALKSCTMIVTERNKFVADIHDRTPVLLREPGFDLWLSGEAGLE